ncbi:MAG: hypothetical protein ABL982_17865 [Vicinamibacterales bacterium]
MRPRVLIVAMLVSLLAGSVRATVLLPADLAELSRDARIIARGQVVAIDAQWSDGRRAIETIVTLEAESYLKGEMGRMVQFRVPGGTMGRYRNIVMGAPQFSVGQRVVVFLGANGPRVPFILGLSQGVYRLGVTASGDVLVSPPPIMPGVTGPIVRGAATRQPSPLADFERSVRALAGGGR